MGDLCGLKGDCGDQGQLSNEDVQISLFVLLCHLLLHV